MLVKVCFTQSQIDKILKEIVVLVDTREQENKHILDYFDKKGIKYKVKKLEFGDYSAMICKNEELGILQDISFEDNFVIEKKNSLEEISGNLTNDRTRIENEFIRAKQRNCNIHLLIENSSYNDIYHHNYRTNFNEKAFCNSLLSMINKFNIKLHFIEKENTAIHMLRIMQIEIKNMFKE